MNYPIDIVQAHNISMRGKGEITETGELICNYSKIKFSDELEAIDIIQMGSSPSVTKTAAGAGLGFLLAGPWGTALGALAGTSAGKDTLMLTLTNQRALLIQVDKRHTNKIVLFR